MLPIGLRQITPFPPLRGGSFSKAPLPGLRPGWEADPKHLIKRTGRAVPARGAEEAPLAAWPAGT
jgi:hypothetical protein